MAKKPKMEIEDMDHYLAARGVDRCKMQEIFVAVKEDETIKKNRFTSAAQVVAYLEKHGVGGLAQTVENVHRDLVDGKKILYSECSPGLPIMNKKPDSPRLF